MVERDIRLAEKTGAVICIQHISARESVELIRQAKKRGVHVHAEATPHHFTLIEEAAIRYGTLAKMNPPLREEADRIAIIEGLKDGTIDIIATDHAPHSREEKDKPITEAPSGIIGLETLLPLGITSLVETGQLTVMELLRKMTCNPAKLYGLERGYLAEGAVADLVLFDPKEEYEVRGFASKSCNSPFLGWKLTGKVAATICDGKIIYDTRDTTLKKKVTAKVMSQTRIAPGIYDMWIASDLAAQAKPGQFIAVYPKDKSTLLPRPISICETDPDREALRIVYRVAGI